MVQLQELCNTEPRLLVTPPRMKQVKGAIPVCQNQARSNLIKVISISRLSSVDKIEQYAYNDVHASSSKS
jgi:hypothetical protein